MPKLKSLLLAVIFAISAHAQTALTPVTPANAATAQGTSYVSPISAGTVPNIPQGRLTLVSGVPVMVANEVAQSTLYYDCYLGNRVPYYTGTTDALDSIGSCEVSTAMQSSSTGVLNSGGVFDVWWVHTAATICISTNGSGGGWASDTGGSNTARGSGYSQVHNTRGYWTNANSIAHCYNGATDEGSITADRATYLGTIYTTAAGQTGMNYQPAATAGGCNNILGLYNAYNRVATSAYSRDSTVTWTNTSSTWGPADAGATGSGLNNRISFVDGLGQSSILASYALPALAFSNTFESLIGTSLDSSSVQPNYAAGEASDKAVWIQADTPLFPVVGFHFVQAMEAIGAGDGGHASTFVGIVNGAQQQRLIVTLPM